VNAKGHFVSVHIAKGHVKDMMPRDQRINYVDGISGATMTGKFLSAGMKDILKHYEPLAIQLRTHEKMYLRPPQ
jgi:Na+-transporting NADH:ubiquinone oxidoreductase subunit C